MLPLGSLYLELWIPLFSSTSFLWNNFFLGHTTGTKLTLSTQMENQGQTFLGNKVALPLQDPLSTVHSYLIRIF